MINGQDYTLLVREYKDESPSATSVNFEINYTMTDRRYMRDIDDCLSALCQRLNEGGFNEFNKFVEVIEAWLEGGDDNV